MNRIIKFRGKPLDKQFGEWAEGYYLQDLNNGQVKHYIFNCPMQIEVDPKTVGQLTGLKDKKGDDIYEGDIITSDGIHRRAIEWNSYECKFNATSH